MPQAKAITLSQALQLMPEKFHPNTRLSGRRQLIQSPMGIIAFHQSSLLESGYWITSHNEHEIGKKIDYILFAIGLDGIIILSSEVLYSFKDKNYLSRFYNDGFPIRIYKENNKYFWQGREGYKMDVTQHFYPCK